MMVQKEVLKLHREAMALADRADELTRQAETARACDLLRQAFRKEQSAANALTHLKDVEPTRSVLFRSAASLALECSEYEEAALLVTEGLNGNPPEEIRLELRNLMPAADKLSAAKSPAARLHRQRQVRRAS